MNPCLFYQFFVQKGPAAAATDAPRAEGLLCNPVMKMWGKIIVFSLIFQLMEHRWNEIDRGKPKYSGKTCPSATFSTTNLTWTGPGSNLGLRGGRPATNRLSHGTAYFTSYQGSRFSPYQALSLALSSQRQNCVFFVRHSSNARITQAEYLVRSEHVIATEPVGWSRNSLMKTLLEQYSRLWWMQFQFGMSIKKAVKP